MTYSNELKTIYQIIKKQHNFFLFTMVIINKNDSLSTNNYVSYYYLFSNN